MKNWHKHNNSDSWLILSNAKFLSATPPPQPDPRADVRRCGVIVFGNADCVVEKRTSTTGAMDQKLSHLNQRLPWDIDPSVSIQAVESGDPKDSAAAWTRFRPLANDTETDHGDG